MSEFSFGVGRGHLSTRVAKTATKAGAELVNYTDPGCSCREGCSGYRCPANRRHWFAGPNRGEPWDRRLAERVMAAVREAATAADRELLGLAQGDRR